MPSPKVSDKDGEITIQPDEDKYAKYYCVHHGEVNEINPKNKISTLSPYEYTFYKRWGNGKSHTAVCGKKKLTPAVKVTSSMSEQTKAPFANIESYSAKIARTTRSARKGDWIEIERHHTDGTVIQI